MEAFINSFTQELITIHNDKKPVTNREKKIIREGFEGNKNMDAIKQQLIDERSMTNQERKQKQVGEQIDRPIRIRQVEQPEDPVIGDIPVRLTNQDKKRIRENQVQRIMEEQKNKIEAEIERKRLEQEQIDLQLAQKHTQHNLITGQVMRKQNELQDKLLEERQIEAALQNKVRANSLLEQKILKKARDLETPDAPTCKICLEKSDKLRTLVPCGHYGYCAPCIEYFKRNGCPVCRTTIREHINTYI
jgi:hypothetical protein